MATKANLLNKMEALAGGSAGRPILRLFIEPIDESSCTYFKSCFSSELHEDTNIFTNDLEWGAAIIKMHCGGEGFIEDPPPEPKEKKERYQK